MKHKLELLITAPLLLVLYPIMALILVSVAYYHSIKVVAREGVSGLQERFDLITNLVEIMTEEMKND